MEALSGRTAAAAEEGGRAAADQTGGWGKEPHGWAAPTREEDDTPLPTVPSEIAEGRKRIIPAAIASYPLLPIPVTSYDTWETTEGAQQTYSVRFGKK